MAEWVLCYGTISVVCDIEGAPLIDGNVVRVVDPLSDAANLDFVF